METLALGMEGQSAKSLDCALAHLDEWPRDAMIFVLPMGAFGLLHSPAWPITIRRVSTCASGMRNTMATTGSSSPISAGRTPRTATSAKAATSPSARSKVGARTRNAVHALAHAMFEDGSGDDAERLISDWLPGYDRSGLLHGHISWHQALVALEQGDVARALAIYAERVQPKVTTAPPLNSVTDGASLLWRLAAYGHTVPKEIWDDAAAHAERSFPKAGVPFADMHMALVAAATGNHASLAQRIADLEKRLADGKLAPGPMLPAVCRAMLAFADGDYKACARTLEPIAAEVVRIGGSHAQREIVEDTLLVAFMKGGEPAKARELLDRRLHRRPSPRDARWRAAVVA